VGKRLAPVRRLSASIREIMSLVAAVAVSFRWPGLTVPVSLLFLYALARRRDVLGRPTRVALTQVALALYFPPAAGLLLVPFQGWDQYLEVFPFMPTFIPGALILGLETACAAAFFDSPQHPVATVVLSTVNPLAVIGGLGMVARRGRAWRIACLTLAAAMSAASTFLIWVLLTAGA